MVNIWMENGTDVVECTTMKAKKFMTVNGQTIEDKEKVTLSTEKGKFVRRTSELIRSKEK